MGDDNNNIKSLCWDILSITLNYEANEFVESPRQIATRIITDESMYHSLEKKRGF